MLHQHRSGWLCLYVTTWWRCCAVQIKHWTAICSLVTSRPLFHIIMLYVPWCTYVFMKYSLCWKCAYYYQVPDILNNSVQSAWPCPCHSWGYLHNHHVSMAITHHDINITLRSWKIKSNPSLRQLSARSRSPPVSLINSLSPSLRGRRRSHLPANEGKTLLLQGGLSLSRAFIERCM